MTRLGKRQRALLVFAADGTLSLSVGRQGASDVYCPDMEARFRESEVDRLCDLGLIDYQPGRHFLSRDVILTDAGRAALHDDTED